MEKVLQPRGQGTALGDEELTLCLQLLLSAYYQGSYRLV